MKLSSLSVLWSHVKGIYDFFLNYGRHGNYVSVSMFLCSGITNIFARDVLYRLLQFNFLSILVIIRF